MIEEERFFFFFLDQVLNPVCFLGKQIIIWKKNGMENPLNPDHDLFSNFK